MSAAGGIEAALAGVLAAHYTYTAGRGMTVRCKCGEVVGERGGRASIGNSATHRAHVAAALLPVVTQAQAEALRAALAGIKIHNGAEITTTNLRWAAAHEALSRSYIFDVLTGLADALDARADESGAR